MSVTTLKNLNTNDIIQYQQNRYPVLLIDRINEVTPGVEAEGIKAFTYNEWFFPGHFKMNRMFPVLCKWNVSCKCI